MTNKIPKDPDISESFDYEDFLKAADDDPSLAAIAILPRTALFDLVKDFIRTINNMLTATDKNAMMASLDPDVKTNCERITTIYIKAITGSPFRGENHPSKAINQVLDFWNAYMDEIRKRNFLPSPV